VLEKDVVLEICKKAASILRRRLGINVYLTRDADHRVPPAGRAVLANSRRAAAFVSVHCDSWPGGRRRGYGAFVFPEPSQEGGYWAPQAERRASVGSADIGQGILMKPWRKTQGRYGAESQKLASAIVGEMARVHDGPAMGIKRVSLVSLAGVDAPAVVVRCGFLSNKDDLRLLSGSESRDRLGAALARGIEIYLSE
jgi:N-acetylmuramoyl-L-alanine amidase